MPVILFFFFFSILGAYESLHDLMDLKKPEQASVFVFDLDHTLMEPLTYTGSEVWFNELLATQDSIEKIIDYYNQVQHAVKMQKTQPEAPDLLHEILNSDHEILFMTSRGPKIVDVTINQLNQAGYHLENKSDFCLKNSQYTCKNNIYFTSGGHKGETLAQILQSYQALSNKKVIFIDDQRRHVERVEGSLNKRGYDIQAYHFTASIDRFERMKEDRERALRENSMS